MLRGGNALTLGSRSASLGAGFWRKLKRKALQCEDIAQRHTHVQAAARLP